MQRGKLSRKFYKIKRINVFRLIGYKGKPAQITEKIYTKAHTLEISKHQGK